MKNGVTEAMVEQLARHNENRERARYSKAGVPAPARRPGYFEAIAREYFHHCDEFPSAMEATFPPVAEPPKAPPRPLPAPLAPVPPRSAEPSPAAAVAADRARVAALIAMTAEGDEADAECREAIRVGTTVEQYASTVAARFILSAMYP